MGRSRSRMFRGRASYKASDVASLFLMGLFLGATSYVILTCLVWLFDRIAGKP